MSVPSKLRDGKESFHGIGDAPSFTLAEFWQWSASDILNNALRGVLAEFIVAKALGYQIVECRTEWDSYDLLLRGFPWRNRTAEDGIRVEVKSSAYLQSWPQPKGHSKVGFDIAPKQKWDEPTGKHDPVKKRHSDVYVFCHLKHKDKETVDPLNLSQWDFYVVATDKINSDLPSHRRAGLQAIRRLTPRVLSYGDIRQAVLDAAKLD